MNTAKFNLVKIIKEKYYFYYKNEQCTSKKQFKELVEQHGMDIISQDSIKFEAAGLWDGTDCISMFRKPF
jgi:hypothetical protein